MTRTDALRPAHSASDTEPALNVERVRSDFPALARTVYGRPLVYLDNAATSHKPRAVVERVKTFYESENSNVHRGVHRLSQEATELYESARARVQTFLNAATPSEIVFTRGTTEAINLVASSFLRPRLQPGDEILLTTMEHHSNIVPWQLVAAETGARLTVVPVSESGELVYEDFLGLVSDRTRLLAVCHTSNALGTINPVREMVRDVKGLGIPVLIDGAQAVSHGAVDVRDLGCDFFCFSGHKMFGPMGVGALYARWEHLESMPPYQGGGEMIDSVSFSGSTYAEPPARFEAGTPNVAGAVGLAAAIDYVCAVGLEAIARHEQDLVHYGTQALNTISDLRVVGTASRKAPVFSFVVNGTHPYDVGTLLDRQGVAVRTGHHCTEPLMRRFGLPGTVRASLAFYNSRGDVDALVKALGEAMRILV